MSKKIEKIPLALSRDRPPPELDRHNMFVEKINELVEAHNATLPQEGHDFAWALEQLKLGNKVSRISWDTDKKIYLDHGLLRWDCSDAVFAEIHLFEAKNWVIA